MYCLRYSDRLVLEMPCAGEDHGHVVLIAVPDRLIILHRSAGLDHDINAMLMRDLYAVGEGEESIRSHHTSAKIKAKSSGLLYRLTQGINA